MARKLGDVELGPVPVTKRRWETGSTANRIGATGTEKVLTIFMLSLLTTETEPPS